MASRLRRPSLFGYEDGLVPAVDRFYSATPCVMEVGIPAGYSSSAKPADMLDSKTTKLPKAVNFDSSGGRLDGRKKYLTAKYGSHQMTLIRKRLGVEMWLLDEMAKLYGTLPEEQGVPYKELDLDQLLDIDEVDLRRSFLRHFLSDASAATRQQIETFIEELLSQANKL